jgi:hypothetical protein
MSDKDGNPLPEPLRFVYHTNPPVDIDDVTDHVSRLDQPGVDVVLLNTNDALMWWFIEQLSANGRWAGGFLRWLAP